MSHQQYRTRCIEVSAWLEAHGIIPDDTIAAREADLAAYAAHGLRGIDAIDRVRLRDERGWPDWSSPES